MFSNMLAALVERGRIRTTERKARELRSVAERAVTRASALGDILLKRPENLAVEDRARLIHAMRLVRRVARDRDVVLKLFRDVAPKYIGRPGGYTRMFKLRFRRGDGAPMAVIELIDAVMPEREWDKDEAKEKRGKGRLLGRLRRKKKG
jgi:large subunit ribosomal protein L17